MSIKNIPFIIGAVLGPRITYTPPSRAILDHERVADRVEDILQPIWVARCSKVLVDTMIYSDVSLGIRNRSGSSNRTPALSRVLKLLLIDANAERLRITPLSAFGAILSLCGGLIRLICYRQLGMQFTPELSIRDDHKLITSGTYAVVRHPSYSGGLLAVLSAFLSLLSWVLVVGIGDIKFSSGKSTDRDSASISIGTSGVD